MADYIFDTEVPSGQAFDGGWHTVGVLCTVSVAANAIGGRAWFPNPKPANFLWLLYRVSDQVVVAQVDLAALPGTTVGQWNAFTSASFATPGNVALSPAPGEQYIPAIATNGDFVFDDTFAYPVNHGGIITATAARFFNGGTGATFPGGGSATDAFFADVLVQAPAVQGSAALSAQTSLAAAGLVHQQAVATLSAQSALSAAGVVNVPGSAGLSAQTGLSAGGSVTQFAAVSLTALSGLTVSAVNTVFGAVALSALAVLSARADDVVAPGVLIASGSPLSTLSAAAAPATVLTAAGSPQSALTASGTP